MKVSLMRVGSNTLYVKRVRLQNNVCVKTKVIKQKS